MQMLQVLFKKACEVRHHAYAPYSKFLVGACIEAEEGHLFTGCNIENASYGVAICAESNTIAAMIAAGKRQIKQIMIVVEGPNVSAPCGACRQRLYEFSSPNTLVHLATVEIIKETYHLNELLPHAFGPADLTS